LTTPRSSKPPSPDSADIIGAEIVVSQRWALLQHSCKPIYPACADFIVAELEVIQHSCKAFYPNIVDPGPVCSVFIVR
jgi:hypothetical protein